MFQLNYVKGQIFRALELHSAVDFMIEMMITVVYIAFNVLYSIC